MFTDRYFGKKRAKRAAAQAPADAAGPSPDLDAAAGAQPDPAAADGTPERAGATLADDPEAQGPREGLSLEDYARATDLTETEVWRRLRRGELVGRTSRGRLTIYTSPAAAAAAEDGLEDLHQRLADEADPRAGAESRPLPPLPDAATEGAGRAGASAQAAPGPFLALSGSHTHSPEMALLLDHLSLAKEENREILRMTQESIRKVTELTESIVEMKDALIEAKDLQIGSLKGQLDEQQLQIKRLLQQKEDLEMLARTMADAAR